MKYILQMPSLPLLHFKLNINDSLTNICTNPHYMVFVLSLFHLLTSDTSKQISMGHFLTCILVLLDCEKEIKRTGKCSKFASRNSLTWVESEQGNDGRKNFLSDNLSEMFRSKFWRQYLMRQKSHSKPFFMLFAFKWQVFIWKQKCCGACVSVRVCAFQRKREKDKEQKRERER